ncbi:hypothetical protein VTN77DRAFT_1744 [Rasamsonia byssochlamydoides]|uniref:uncharacterized protein n=1 Tax=Rasamsonia byssochlamydoides TaxID=89139 RepID=UPI00374282AA
MSFSVSPITCSISCLCGHTAQEIALDPLVKPSSLQVCHCNPCRYTSGLLCSSYLVLYSPPILSTSLREYKQSNNVSRWFCATCGAHVFAHVKQHNKYLVAAGLLTTPDIAQTESLQHWGVKDTKDGGLAIFLTGPRTNEKGLCWLEVDKITDEEHSRQESSCLEDTGHLDSDRLHARCHCGGIEFYVTAPDVSSSNASSPWPDLLVPYHSASSDNPQDVKWWLRAGNTKYLAGTCACTSCRRASGFPIQTWAFIPKSNIFKMDNSSLSFDLGTMQRYESSPAIFREFCNRCGATVFWHCQERPGVIDVSVGLLRSTNGARAEEWLEWATGRVSFSEDAHNKPLIQMLETGLQGKISQT